MQTSTLSPEEIQRALRGLAAADVDRKVFGAAGHNYELRRPVPLSEVAAFEALHRIRLPTDYRAFLLEVGNGGAGPGYGILPLGSADSSRLGSEIRMGKICEPFPHQESWNLDAEFWAREPDPPDDISQADEDRQFQEWDELLDSVYWTPDVMNGAIPLCEMGCGQTQWLVVNGEPRGTVWTDLRADNAGLEPVINSQGTRATFIDWYGEWLERSTVDAQRLVEVRRQGRRADVINAIVLILLGVVVAVLIGLWRH